MRRNITGVLATIVVLLGTGAFMPAQADTQGCVSQHEFKSVKKGMTPRQVARVFDTKGEPLDGGAGGYAQGYKKCSGGGVIIEYAWRAGDNRVHLATKASTSRSVVDCVSQDEWRQVYVSPDGVDNGPGEGGTKARVHRIFGTTGWVVHRFTTRPGDAWQVRKYQRCGSVKTRTIQYHKIGDNPWWSYWG